MCASWGRCRARRWCAAYAASTVFVFPSRTDTFGLVLLEALACGLPVAAYPVPGPLDVVGPEAHGGPVAALDEDLEAACLRALEIAREPRQARPRGNSPWAIPGGPAPCNSCATSWSSRTPEAGCRQAG